MTRIFVYGTLKRGAENHRFLAGQTFVGPACTIPGYTLFALAGYPGLVAWPGDDAGVSGEVWSVDNGCLAQLDELEGLAEGLYRRATVPLQPPFADPPVESYVYARSVAGRTRIGATWNS